MCGAEALLIAVTLATQLIEPVSIGRSFINYATSECNPVKCGGTDVEIATWRLLQAQAAEDAAKAHNAKVKEFSQIARMCGVMK